MGPNWEVGMVEVSLYELVLVKDSRRAWPAEFRAMVEKCEADLTDRLPFGVVADWLDEKGETALGEAFRWLHKRKEVQILDGRDAWSAQYARLIRTPPAVGSVEGDPGYGLIGVIVALSERLAEMREAMA